MIFWAVLGFGLFLLLVAFAMPRLAFTITLVALLYQSGWMDYFGKNDPSAAEFLATILTVILILFAGIGGSILDWVDHSNR